MFPNIFCPNIMYLCTWKKNEITITLESQIKSIYCKTLVEVKHEALLI